MSEPVAGKRFSRATLVVAISLVGLLFPTVGRSNASAAVEFSAEGDIIGGNPATQGGLNVTENSFVISCLAGEYPPPSQGVDAYVFQLPEALTQAASTRVTGSGSPIGHDLDVYFYDDECAFIDNTSMATGSADETGSAPIGTRYVSVDAWIGLNTHVTLNVSGGVEPSPTATASPSPTESPTPETPEVATTLAADREVAGYQQPFLLAGQVTGDPECGDLSNFQVSITKLVSGAMDVNALSSSVPVRSDGTWSYEHRSANSASYAASVERSSTCADAPAATEDVGVSAKVSATTPNRCRAPERVSGSVAPTYAGTKVLLQRRSGGAWRTMDTDRLSSGSRFTLKATRCSGSYRVFWPKQHSANEAGARYFKF
jgi:hypothetical protein